MKATIADIRRGDRFTWAGRTYIAFDDARPSRSGIANNDDWIGSFHEIRMIQTKNITAAEDGSYHQGTAFVDCQPVLSTKDIEIHERDLITVRLSEEPEHADRPISEWDALHQLTATMSARTLAQRIADDVDQTRDQRIRDALKVGISVSQIMEITGLSRARIYQIRDGKR